MGLWIGIKVDAASNVLPVVAWRRIVTRPIFHNERDKEERRPTYPRPRHGCSCATRNAAVPSASNLRAVSTWCFEVVLETSLHPRSLRGESFVRPPFTAVASRAELSIGKSRRRSEEHT